VQLSAAECVVSELSAAGPGCWHELMLPEGVGLVDWIISVVVAGKWWVCQGRQHSLLVGLWS
jgi:hypothetical protein